MEKPKLRKHVLDEHHFDEFYKDGWNDCYKAWEEWLGSDNTRQEIAEE